MTLSQLIIFFLINLIGIAHAQTPQQAKEDPEEPSKTVTYTQLRTGLFNIGIEQGFSNNDSIEYYLAFDHESMFYYGDWQLIHAGSKFIIKENFFIKAELGWQIDHAISKDLSGLFIGTVLGWQSKPNWQIVIEPIGLKIFLTPSSRRFSAAYYVPKIGVSYYWE